MLNLQTASSLPGPWRHEALFLSGAQGGWDLRSFPRRGEGAVGSAWPSSQSWGALPGQGVVGSGSVEGPGHAESLLVGCP